MKTSIKIACLVSAISAVFAVQLHAQKPVATPNAEHSAKADLSRGDKKFLIKAAKSGMKEVAVSDAVASKLTAPGAKEFALMMVTAHTAVNAELSGLAARKGVTLPAEDPDVRKKWSSKTKDVDEDYFEEMVDDHKKAVSLFEKATKSEDPDIAAFATKTLPSLRHHLSEAEKLEDQTD